MKIEWHPSIFCKVNLVHALFSTYFAPSPRSGGVPELPFLIGKPSTAVVAIFLATITFCDLFTPSSFPGVPAWSVANATCTAWRHQSAPSKFQRCPQPSYQYWLSKTWMIAQRLEEGQPMGSHLTDPTDVIMISFIQTCHCNLVGTAMWGKSWHVTESCPTTSFPFREPIDSHKPVSELSLTVGDSRTFGTHSYQKSIIKVL